MADLRRITGRITRRFTGRITRRIAWLPLCAAIIGCSSGPDAATAERIKALEGRVEALEARLKAPAFERVAIVDKDGKERAMFGLREEDASPALRLKDESGRNRALLRLHPDGTPIFVLWGQDGKGTAYLSVPGEGPPNLMFFDKDGAKPVTLP